MGKSPKGFSAHTLQFEEKVKVIIKYVTAKKSRGAKEEHPVRMSNLNDSFLSFENGKVNNSTLGEFEDSLSDVVNKNMLASVAPKEANVKTPKKKKIKVKISIEKLNNPFKNLENTDEVVLDDFFNESSFSKSNVSHNISQDSLDDISKVKSFNQAAITKQNKDILSLRNCQSLLEFDDLKKRVLLPTDAYYYTPQTKSKPKDEEIADIIKELVLKKFERKEKERPRKKQIALLANSVDVSNSNTMEKFINRSDIDKTFRMYPASFHEKSGLPQADSTTIIPSFAQKSKISATYEEPSLFLKNNIYKEPIGISIGEDKQRSEIDRNLLPNTMAAKLPGRKANNIVNNFLNNKTINQTNFKARTQNFVLPKCKPKQSNQTCHVVCCEPERREMLMKEINSTSGNSNDTNEKQLEKLPNIFLKSPSSNASYCTPKKLTNISSCSSQGVYDCFQNSALKKEEISPYFKEIERITKNTNSQKSLSYEEIQYDEHTFLRKALGSEMDVSISDVSFSTNKPESIYDFSIDTDNISTLVSSESCDFQKLSTRKLKRKINSVNTFTSILTEESYEDLANEAKYMPKHNIANSSCQHDSGMSSGVGSKKATRKSLPSVAVNKDIVKQPRKCYPLYEDVLAADTSNKDVNKTKGANEDLLERISQQEEMIRQAEWMLEYGSKQSHFYGGSAHLAIERIRLVSTLRKDALEKQLIGETYKIQVREETELAKLVIKNVTCTNSTLYCEKSRKNQYFIGIFKSDVTVLCTSFAQPNMFGDVEFERQFIFEDLKSDFEIEFNLYSLTIENKDIGSDLNCFQRSLSKRYNKKYLELVGTHKFIKSNIGTKKAIKLTNYRYYFASYKFSANSCIFVNP